VINLKLLVDKADILIGILKHKLGTPVRGSGNRNRSVSGTAEEINYAVRRPDTILPMIYMYDNPPYVSLDDENLKAIQKEWNRMKKYRSTIRKENLYGIYSKEEEFLDKIPGDLKKNIIDVFLKD
jgi:hypothetical protein